MATTITDVAGWQAINNDLTADYELGANLDFTGEDAVIDGDGDDNFTGTLDGKDYTISNITITLGGNYGGLFYENQGTITALNIDTISVTNTQTTGAYASAFTHENSGTITDVVITNATLAATSSTGNYAEAQGFLYRNNVGTITRCSVSFDTITATSAGTYARAFGFCNDNYGTIDESFANGTTITATATGQYAFVASFCEDNTATPDAEINDCYAIVDTLTATDGSTWAWAAGFIINNADIIDNCYVQNNTITAADSTNGFSRTNNGSCTNCFWDKQTSGVTDDCEVGSGAGATGKSTAQMKDFCTFDDADWDIWKSGQNYNNGYPYLGWQYSDDTAVWAILGNSGTRCFDIPNVLDDHGRPPKGAVVRAYRADTNAEITAARTVLDANGKVTICDLPLDVDIMFHVTWGGGG